MSETNDLIAPRRGSRKYSPLYQIVLARLREFTREPEAMFWTYGFPILMVVALGIAFRNKPVDRITVDVPDGPRASAVVEALQTQERFVLSVRPFDECELRLRTAKTDIVVVPGVAAGYRYEFDATRSESVLSRNIVDDVLQRAAGRKDAVATSDVPLDAAGTRYIDFLVPGLLGMGIMGGGLWGIGFVTVDMRIRKLLKRFLATPMRKSQFLSGLMLSRLVFMVPEVLILLVFARLAFGVKNHGNPVALLVLILLGALEFCGIGLLVASRARTQEAVNGLMNLVMLPMWVFSGIFFSSERFPDAMQPLVHMLPLTPLLTSLRAVMLEGATLASQATSLAIIALWGAVTFGLALRWFRWI